MKANVLLKKYRGSTMAKYHMLHYGNLFHYILFMINVPAEYFILIGQLHQISMFYSVLFFIIVPLSCQSHKITKNILISNNLIIRFLDNLIIKHYLNFFL